MLKVAYLWYQLSAFESNYQPEAHFLVDVQKCLKDFVYLALGKVL